MIGNNNLDCTHLQKRKKDEDNKIKILDTKDVSPAQTFEVYGNPATKFQK